jgi:putative addiction module component (TIGR02574 family)
MASAADRVLDEALKLEPDERARIVAELLATLEPDLPTEQRGEAEWVQEIERRARAAIAGSPGISWTEARAQIRSRLSSQ